jgi:hypothetical protein
MSVQIRIESQDTKREFLERAFPDRNQDSGNSSLEPSSGGTSLTFSNSSNWETPLVMFELYNFIPIIKVVSTY